MSLVSCFLIHASHPTHMGRGSKHAQNYGTRRVIISFHSWRTKPPPLHDGGLGHQKRSIGPFLSFHYAAVLTARPQLKCRETPDKQGPSPSPHRSPRAIVANRGCDPCNPLRVCRWSEPPLHDGGHLFFMNNFL